MRFDRDGQFSAFVEQLSADKVDNLAAYHRTGTCKVKTTHYILKKMQVKSFGHSRTGKRR